MTRSLLGASALTFALLSLSGCGDAGAVDADPTAQNQPLDLRGAIWMESDGQHDSFLVLSHRDLGERRVSELLVLNMDGSLRRSWDLEDLDLSFDWPLDAPLWFPALSTLVIVSSADRGAWAVNVQTGKSTVLSSSVTSAAADTVGGRLFLAEDKSLRVVDVATRATVASHTLSQSVPAELTIGTGGSLNFVLTAAGGPAWHRIGPPGYEMKTLALREDREAHIDAVDDQRHRAFVQHADPYEAYLEVVSMEDPGDGARQPRLASDLFFPHVAGLWKGAALLWIQNDAGALPPGVELKPEMWLYDVETLRRVRMVPTSLDESRDEMRRGPLGQVVVLRDALRVESWDPESLEVSARVDLPGTAGPWAVDWNRGTAAFITFQNSAGSSSAQFVRVELATMRLS